MGAPSRVSRRRPVGAIDGRSLERVTREIPLALYLLEATPRLDSLRRVSRRVGSTARRADAAARHRLGGSDRRRLVCSCKKGGDEVGRGRKGNGSNILVMTDGNDLPLSAFITAANTSEVHAIETLVDECHCSTAHWPKRLLYDKAADADWLRKTLAGRGIELICPHRKNRTKPPLQDGRSLRRYKRRYKIERSISWLQRFHRLITRWEYYPELFEGFVHLACLYTTMQRL